jgi:hypothetical protein
MSETDTNCAKRDGRDNSKHEKCEMRRYVQHCADFAAIWSNKALAVKVKVLTTSE